MGVEFDIRLGSRVIQIQEFLRSVESLSGILLGADLSLRGLGPAFQTMSLGASESVMHISTGEVAEIQCCVYSAGEEEALGAEGGWWASLALVERTSTSFWLLVVASAVLAQMAGTTVVDESRLLKRGREIAPETVVSLLQSLGSNSLEGVSKDLCGRVCVSFGR